MIYFYRNTQTSDLWECISQDKEFLDLMEQWTKIKGFPILKIEKGKSRNGEQVFIFRQDPCQDDVLGVKWKIPLSYVTTSGLSGQLFIDGLVSTISLPIPESDLVKFNNNSTCFCQIEYYPDYLMELCRNADEFSIHNRMGLINDILLDNRHNSFESLRYILEILKSIKEQSLSEISSNYYLYTMLEDSLQLIYPFHTIQLLLRSEDASLSMNVINSFTEDLFTV